MNAQAMRWRCRRGLLELDLALRRFLDTVYEGLTPPEQTQFSDLLAENDADIWAWIQGAPAPARYAPVLRYFTLDTSFSDKPR